MGEAVGYCVDEGDGLGGVEFLRVGFSKLNLGFSKLLGLSGGGGVDEEKGAEWGDTALVG